MKQTIIAIILTFSTFLYASPKDLSKRYFKKSVNSKLIKAAIENDLSKVKLLLKQSVNVNETTNYGDSALMWFAWNGNIDAVKELLKHDLNVNLKSNYGDTPLMWAVMSKKMKMVKYLLSIGADVNATTNFNITALMEAGATGDIELTQLLLNFGANPFVVDKSGADAISWGKRAGHKDTSQLIEKSKELDKFRKYRPKVSAIKKSKKRKKKLRKLDVAKESQIKGQLYSQFKNKDSLVLMYVYADYCPPCRVMKPDLKKFKDIYKNKVSIVPVDVQKFRKSFNIVDQKIINGLIKKHQLYGTPALLFLAKKGKEIVALSTKFGAQDFKTLSAWLKNTL